MKFNRTNNPNIDPNTNNPNEPEQVKANKPEQIDPRKIILPEKILSKLSKDDQELYACYLKEDWTFTPNWIQMALKGEYT